MAFPLLSNQIFAILPNKLVEQLQKQFIFHIWQKSGENQSVVRLVTSWATSETAIQKFIKSINSYRSGLKEN